MSSPPFRKSLKNLFPFSSNHQEVLFNLNKVCDFPMMPYSGFGKDPRLSFLSPNPSDS